MALPPVDLHTRLTSIKYLYRIALNHSHQPQSLEAAVSILSFHDSVESFLHLALEHHGAQAGRPDFLEYWTLLGKVGCNLTPPGPLRRFNDVRVGFKHRGIIPSSQEIESARVNVTAFFETNTPIAFPGLTFEGISLGELVQHSKAKASLQQAEALIEGGELGAALEQLALAFRLLLDHYGTNPVRPDGFPFPLSKVQWRLARLARPRHRGLSTSYDDLSADMRHDLDAVAGTVDEIIDAISNVESAIHTLSLGIDFRRYWRFVGLTPSVDVLNGEATFHRNPGRTTTPTVDECRYCFDFVIDLALRLQEVPPIDP